MDEFTHEISISLRALDKEVARVIVHGDGDLGHILRSFHASLCAMGFDSNLRLSSEQIPLSR